MGKKGRNMNSRKPLMAGTSNLSNKILVIASLMVAVSGYALYHLFSIGAHLDWIYNPPIPLQVERYVMNDSISYRYRLYAEIILPINDILHIVT